jgi:peptide/nickel transport system substrate-binding protein
MHIYKSIDVLSLALEKGDVDTYFKYASSYPYSNIDRLKETQKFNFVEKLNIGLVFLGFNLKKQPCSDPIFRKALSYAIDYKEILKLDALGYGEVPNSGFVPKSMGEFKTTDKLEYYSSKAKELLLQGGYRDSDGNGILEDKAGKELKLTILVRSNWVRVAELLKDYLSAIGIESVTRSADLNTWVAEKDKYNYDLTITRTTPWGMLMHAGLGTGYFDSRRTGRGVLHILDDPTFLNLADSILSTTDSTELSGLSSRVQDYYAEYLPAVALYWNTIVTPFNKSFSGWMPDPLYGIYNVDNFLNVEYINK